MKGKEIDTKIWQEAAKKKICVQNCHQASSIKQSLLNLPTAERVYLCVLQGIYYDT